jgi:hypothetical protein
VTRLSIIIPCLAPDGRLDDTLASVLQNRPDDCEVLVVHRDAYDDPYGLAGEVTFLAGQAEEGLVELLNRGLAACKGEFIHTLSCGFEVEEGWSDGALAGFSDPLVAAVSPVVTERGNPQQIVSAGLAAGRFGARQLLSTAEGAGDRCSPARQPIGPVLAAGFYRRSSLAAVGGFEPLVGPLADLDCALSLALAGFRCSLEASSRVLGDSTCSTGQSAFAEGQAAERLFWRHAAARGALAAVLRHALDVTVSFATGMLRGGAAATLLGRLAALPEAPRHLRHSARIRGVAAGSPMGRRNRQRFDAAHAKRAVPTSAETAVR